MIEVKNLTKIYTSKKGETCVALDHINFTLPDTGLVFVVGKSGSGKSTLLNLLGGLDEITSGEIVVDGAAFSQIKGGDGFDAFRNSYMGFVFQDYYLIESLNVFENIKFALDLRGKQDDEKIYNVLDKLGISDLAKRRPRELSGGQQQRVAIARAIVKNPSLILADEPTGNLDELTTTQILDIFKVLAKRSLVVIVSHNIENAYKYGDRIIRLENGKIFSDISRTNSSKNELEVKDDEIVLPNGAPLTEEELNKINDKVKNGGVKISQQQPLFAQTQEGGKNESRAQPQFLSSHLSFKNTCTFTAKFTRASLFNFIASTLIVSFLLILFGLCQILYAYNGDSLLKETLNPDQDVIILQKAYVADEIFKLTKTDRLNRVTEEDLQVFRDGGYKGNMYLLYNDAIAYSTKVDLECYQPLNQGSVYSNFFAGEAFGTLMCDEEYLNKVFGGGEPVTYYGDQYAEPYGLVITDYIADSLLYHNSSYRANTLEDSYDRLLNAKRPINGRFKINAIINTNYHEKYKNLYDEFLKASSTENPTSYAKKIYSSKDFKDFVEDARLKLNIAYALDESYFDEQRVHPSQTKHFIRFPDIEFYDNDGKMKYSSVNGAKFGYVDNALKDDEIAAKESLFNEIYPNETFVSNKFEVTIKMYDISRQYGDAPCIEKTFKIKALTDDTAILRVNLNNFAEFRNMTSFLMQFYLMTHKTLHKFMKLARKICLFQIRRR